MTSDILCRKNATRNNTKLVMYSHNITRIFCVESIPRSRKDMLFVKKVFKMGPK